MHAADRGECPPNSVDDWGRDPHLVRLLAPLVHLRWRAAIEGAEHLPLHSGALLVTTARRFSLTAVHAALALGDAIGRPVRFVGRPDIAPIGPLMRRIGGLVADADEVAEALRNHQLVVVPVDLEVRPPRVGAIDPAYIAAALGTPCQVHVVASTSSPIGRQAQVVVSTAVRPSPRRRGPLGPVELAEEVQRRLQALIDSTPGSGR